MKIIKRALMLAALAAPVALTGLIIAPGAVAKGQGPVRMVAVQYHPRGQSGHLNREWVQLRNTGRAVQMRGWTIRDTRGNVYRFGNYTFSRGYMRVHSGQGHNATRDLYWGRTDEAWNDRGGTVMLRNASGAIVQRYHYNGGGTIGWCNGDMGDRGALGAVAAPSPTSGRAFSCGTCLSVGECGLSRRVQAVRWHPRTCRE